MIREEKFKEQCFFQDRLVYFILQLGIVGVVGGMGWKLFNATLGWVELVSFAITLGSLVFTYWWLKKLKLKVSLNSTRIKFKLTPFHGKSKRIPWDEIESCTIEQEPRFAQWLGSNIRMDLLNRYTLTGRNGLSVRTKDGEDYFIGCRDIDALSNFVENQIETPASQR